MFFATVLGGAASLPHRGRQGMATLLQTDCYIEAVKRSTAMLLQIPSAKACFLTFVFNASSCRNVTALLFTLGSCQNHP